MSKQKELSVDLRDRIILLHTQQMREIAKHLNVSKIAGLYNLNKFKEFNKKYEEKWKRKCSWRENEH